MKFRVTHTAEATYIRPEIKKRPGDPASKKIKAVCKNCNNTWMSRIEEIAKPILSPLIMGQDAILSPSDQIAIVQWAVLKTMIGEYDDTSDTRAIDADTQQAFFKRRELIGVWKIWLGNYRGEGAWHSRYRHSPAMLHLAATSVIYPPKVNCQVSTFVGGHLFLQVLYSTFPHASAFGFQGETGDMLKLICPTVEGDIAWPPNRSIADHDADFIAHALNHWPTINQNL